VFFGSAPTTSVWDLTDGSKRNFFTNRNPPHTRLTALNLVNEDDVPLLLTGSGLTAHIRCVGGRPHAPCADWRRGLLPSPNPSTDDGVVRLWRNFDDPHRVSQLTAWRALGDMLVGNRGRPCVACGLVRRARPLTRVDATRRRLLRLGAGAGLVMEWQQRRASLIVSGDTRVIRIWDVERELCAQVRPRQVRRDLQPETAR